MKRLAASLACGLVLALAASVACGPGHENPTPYIGAEAHDFLTLPVTVEILSVEGRLPSAEALDIVTRRLQENASGVAAVVTHVGIRDARIVWDAGSLLWLEREHLAFRAPATLVAIYAPGIYGAFSTPSGITVGPHTVGIFPDVLPDPKEAAISLLHELGHVLGLVKNPSHEDPSSRLHDLDPSCVMFWHSPKHTDFCANCKADLASARRS